MSYADASFIKTCQLILTEGCHIDDPALVRPHWKDGQPATYWMAPGPIVNQYDLRREFPLTTQRPTPIRNAMDEILWIDQQKSNNVKDLNSHIWDAWTDENGSIGKAYGWQVGNKFIDGLDQMDYVLHELKVNPFSRRIIINLWDVDDLPEMNLPPCVINLLFSAVKSNDGTNGLTLNLQLNQRSQDMLVAGNWNVVQYALLQMMVARHVGMTPGLLPHVITNAHIYDRHVEMVEELIARPCYPAPIVTLNPDVHNFYDFTVEDLRVFGYCHGEQIRNIPVAI